MYYIHIYVWSAVSRVAWFMVAELRGAFVINSHFHSALKCGQTTKKCAPLKPKWTEINFDGHIYAFQCYILFIVLLFIQTKNTKFLSIIIFFIIIYRFLIFSCGPVGYSMSKMLNHYRYYCHDNLMERIISRFLFDAHKRTHIHTHRNAYTRKGHSNQRHITELLY